MIAAAVECAAIPLIGAWSDRIGRRPIYIGSAAALAVWAFVFFPLVETGSFALIAVAFTVGLLTHAGLSGVIGAFSSELFGTTVRYSGVSVGYHFASVIAGSLSPIIALGLYTAYDSALSVAIYLAVMALISLGALLVAREARGRDLANITHVDVHGDVAPSRVRESATV